MKPLLVILIGTLSVALGNLNPASLTKPAADSSLLLLVPPVVAPIGGQYRVESENPDGTVSGQYGYRVPGQDVQVTYSTASQTQGSANDENNTASTSGSADTQTASNDTATNQVDVTELTTITSQQPQSQPAVYPQYVAPFAYIPVQISPQSNEVFQTRPITNTYPYQVSYAQAAHNGYYYPYHATGQQGFYSRPSVVRPASGTRVSQINPTYNTVPSGYLGSNVAPGVLQTRPYYPVQQSVGLSNSPGRQPVQVYSALGAVPLSPSRPHVYPARPHATHRYYQQPFPSAYNVQQLSPHRYGIGHRYPPIQRAVRRN